MRRLKKQTKNVNVTKKFQISMITGQFYKRLWFKQYYFLSRSDIFFVKSVNVQLVTLPSHDQSQRQLLFYFLIQAHNFN